MVYTGVLVEKEEERVLLLMFLVVLLLLLLIEADQPLTYLVRFCRHIIDASDGPLARGGLASPTKPLLVPVFP